MDAVVLPDTSRDEAIARAMNEQLCAYAPGEFQASPSVDDDNKSVSLLCEALEDDSENKNHERQACGKRQKSAMAPVFARLPRPRGGKKRRVVPVGGNT